MLTDSDFREFVNLFIVNFNKNSYDYISSRLSDQAVFICPEVNVLLAKTPKTIVHGKENIIEYWRSLKKVTQPEVSEIEFRKFKEPNKVRFHYEQISLIMDANFEFNNDGELDKIEFSIV